MSLGLLYMEEMRDDEATEAFNRAYDISPSDFTLTSIGISSTLAATIEERMRRTRA